MAKKHNRTVEILKAFPSNGKYMMTKFVQMEVPFEWESSDYARMSALLDLGFLSTNSYNRVTSAKRTELGDEYIAALEAAKGGK